MIKTSIRIAKFLLGLYETIERMVPNRRTRFTLDQQLDRFKTTKGLFGKSMALDTRDKNNLVSFTLIFMILLR